MKWLNTLLYDDWKTKLIKATNFYNKGMFYQSYAKSQILMPLGLVNEALWILTYLAVLGIRPTGKVIAIAYVITLFFLIICGKILIWLGWMKYQQRLGNEQNPQVVEIIERLKKIEEKL